MLGVHQSQVYVHYSETALALCGLKRAERRQLACVSETMQIAVNGDDVLDAVPFLREISVPCSSRA